jgi:manganese/iron transport system ATP-binding protein
VSLTNHDTGRPVLEVRDLTVDLDGIIALEDVSFALSRGDAVAVVGPNGAGKSTLFRAVAGVLDRYRGRITVYGSEPGGHICIAFVPQSSHVDWTFPVSVFDAVMMGRTRRIGWVARPSRSDRALVYQCLEMVNLEDLAERQIGELSGGQKQRAFLARALAQEAEIILMDEPLSGLDVKSQQDISAILASLTARGVTLMVSTHDLEAAAARFARIMLLNRRIVAFGGRGEVLTPGLLLATFGGRVRLGGGGEATVIDSCCDGGEGHAS